MLDRIGPTGMEQLSVLVVDDSRNMRDIIKIVLRGLRVGQIHEAGDATAALGELKALPVDLMILDWEMAPMDGLELARLIRTAPDSPAPRLPILMVTGHTEAWRVRAARDAGVTEFLAKPISPKGVADRITAIMRRPRDFVRTEDFVGPDRRRIPAPPPPEERRKRNAALDPAELDRILAEGRA